MVTCWLCVSEAESSRKLALEGDPLEPEGRTIEPIGDNRPRKMIIKYRTPLIAILNKETVDIHSFFVIMN